MSNALTIAVSMSDMERMAEAVVKSGLFGMKTKDEALALMLVAQAEGMHPASAAMEFDIIQKKPARRAQSMLARFQAAGGSVRYTERTDNRVAAIFSHPQGGTVEIDWDLNRAKKVGLGAKDNWIKWPRQMLTARVISEGVRAVFPGATGGFYEPGEVGDMVDITPPKKAANRPAHDPVTGEIKDAVVFPASDDVGPEPAAEAAQPQQTDESARAEKFCNEAIARIDECDSAEKIEGWLATNKTKLDRANAANSEAYDAVIAAAGYRKRKILGAAA